MANINVRCFKMTKRLFLEVYFVCSNSLMVKRVINLQMGLKAKRKRNNSDSGVEDRGGLDPMRC